jgi:hypothetical protein
MKTSIYTIETKALKATISKGIKTKFDWFLEIEPKEGKELISNYRNVWLTKKSCVAEFQRVTKSPYAIKY